MECKLLLGRMKWGEKDSELIDTLWNVNKGAKLDVKKAKKELIDTLWNVNTLEDVIEQTGTTN